MPACWPACQLRIALFERGAQHVLGPRNISARHCAVDGFPCFPRALDGICHRTQSGLLPDNERTVNGLAAARNHHVTRLNPA